MWSSSVSDSAARLLAQLAGGGLELGGAVDLAVLAVLLPQAPHLVAQPRQLHHVRCRLRWQTLPGRLTTGLVTFKM